MKAFKLMIRIVIIVLVGTGIWIAAVLYSWGNLGGAPAKQKELFSAIGRNDTNEVLRLLNDKVSPNEPWIQISHPTPLIAAVKPGYIDIVRLLLDHGADPNKADSFGYSPLYYSLASPLLDDDDISKNIFQMLIEHGANMFGKDIATAANGLKSDDSRIEAYRRACSNATTKNMP